VKTAAQWAGVPVTEPGTTGRRGTHRRRRPGTDQRLTWAVVRVRLGIFVMKVRTVATSAMMPMVV
jgi:hypothetical protein